MRRPSSTVGFITSILRSHDERERATDDHVGDDNHDHKVDDGDRDWRERRN